MCASRTTRIIPSLVGIHYSYSPISPRAPLSHRYCHSCKWSSSMNNEHVSGFCLCNNNHNEQVRSHRRTECPTVDVEMNRVTCVASTRNNKKWSLSLLLHFIRRTKMEIKQNQQNQKYSIRAQHMCLCQCRCRCTRNANLHTCDTIQLYSYNECNSLSRSLRHFHPVKREMTSMNLVISAHFEPMRRAVFIVFSRRWIYSMRGLRWIAVSSYLHVALWIFAIVFRWKWFLCALCVPALCATCDATIWAARLCTRCACESDVLFLAQTKVYS